MRMGHALRRFQRERGVTLSRPVAANSPLQSYFVDPDFAAAAESQMFDEKMRPQLADGVGRLTSITPRCCSTTVSAPLASIAARAMKTASRSTPIIT